MKISFAVVAFVLVQGIGVIWYISKLDSRVDQMYKSFEEENRKDVIENQVKMRLDMANVITDLSELKKEVKKMQNKDQTIIKQNNKIERQHKQIFELIEGNKGQEQKVQYSYD